MIDFVLHFDKHLAQFVASYGVWVYGLLFAIVERNWMLFDLFAVLLVLPVFLIVATRSIPRGKWLEMPGLTILYLTFCVARASALIRPGAWAAAKVRSAK